MIKKIVIKDCNGKEYLDVSLSEILSLIRPFDHGYYWSLYELDAWVIPPGIPGFRDFTEKISAEEKGLPVSLDALIEIAAQLSQVINMLLVASPVEDNFKNYQDKQTWVNDYPLVIEMVDGYRWEIYTTSDELIKLLESKYQDIELTEFPKKRKWLGVF